VLALQPRAPGGGPERLTLLPTGVGEPREIAAGDLRLRTARWLPDGRGVVAVASEGDRPARLYALGLDGAAAAPFGPPGPVSPIFYVSPDGGWVAARAGNDPYVLVPLGGGEPRPIPGFDRRETVLPWTLEPGAGLVQLARDVPTRIDRVNLATGERALWREMVPPDATGSMGMRGFTFARAADAYGYTHTVELDDLYLLEGMAQAARGAAARLPYAASSRSTSPSNSSARTTLAIVTPSGSGDQISGSASGGEVPSGRAITRTSGRRGSAGLTPRLRTRCPVEARSRVPAG
jgi:hypothetical protein